MLVYQRVDGKHGDLLSVKNTSGFDQQDKSKTIDFAIKTGDLSINNGVVDRLVAEKLKRKAPIL